MAVASRQLQHTRLNAKEGVLVFLQEIPKPPPRFLGPLGWKWRKRDKVAFCLSQDDLVVDIAISDLKEN
jgi:hypothetical protein